MAITALQASARTRTQHYAGSMDPEAFLQHHCSSDALEEILRFLPPIDVVRLSLSDKSFMHELTVRRKAIVFARSQARVRLRYIRTMLKQRVLFQRALYPDLGTSTADECVDKLLGQLERSPDGVRDLSAAVQKVMQRISSQSVVAPVWVKRLHQDTVNIASFVCLLAWRSHMRNRRADSVDVHAVEQTDDGVLATAASSSSSEPGTMSSRESTAQSSSSSTGNATPANDRSSQGTQMALYGSLRDVQELLTGFKALVTSSNPSIKPCTATLQLLSWHMHLELQAWHPAMAVAEQAVAEIVEQAAAAAAAAAGAPAGQ